MAEAKSHRSTWKIGWLVAVNLDVLVLLQHKQIVDHRAQLGRQVREPEVLGVLDWLEHENMTALEVSFGDDELAGSQH